MNSRKQKIEPVAEQEFGLSKTLGRARWYAKRDHTHGTPNDPYDGIEGTDYQITVTDNGDGTLTISLPGSLLLSGATASRLLATDADKKTVSVSLSSYLTGTAGRATVTDDGDGTATLTVPLKAGYGIDSDADGLKLKQQAAEADATAVSAIVLGAGADTVDIATFNTALTTLVTEINALKDKFNSLLAKQRSAEIITT